MAWKLRNINWESDPIKLSIQKVAIKIKGRGSESSKVIWEKTISIGYLRNLKARGFKV